MEVLMDKVTAIAAPREMTKESMQLDFEYEIAVKITRSMYEKGMISFDEMNRIMELNKDKFYPFYREIM